MLQGLLFAGRSNDFRFFGRGKISDISVSRDLVKSISMGAGFFVFDLLDVTNDSLSETCTYSEHAKYILFTYVKHVN